MRHALSTSFGFGGHNCCLDCVGPVEQLTNQTRTNCRMRYSPDHKEKTRAKILESAATAFRRQGYHATGVDKVMEEAGLTAGGFYAHFPSKDALLAEALEHYAAKSTGTLNAGLEDVADREWVRAIVDRYLAASHRGHPETRMPDPVAGAGSQPSRQGASPGIRAFGRRP